MNPVWQVQVLRGADRPLDMDAPMKFGVPSIYVSADEVGDEMVPLVYGPVTLHQHGTYLAIQTDGEPVDVGDGSRSIPSQTWRSMDVVTSTEFSVWGHVRIEGFEIREDGSPIYAIWEVEPYVSDVDPDRSN